MSAADVRLCYLVGQVARACADLAEYSRVRIRLEWALTNIQSDALCNSDGETDLNLAIAKAEGRA